MTNVSSNSFKVSQEKRGTTLDDFLSEELLISKKAVKKLLDQSACLLDGKVERRGKRPLFGGETLTVSVQLEKQIAFDPARILHEEQGFIVYDKPINVTVDQQLLKEIQKSGWSLIHRLDRETSGLLLIAKNEAIREKFQTLFEQKQVQKRYIAVVDGELKGKGHLKTFIGEGKSLGGRARFQVTNKESDQVAETDWELLNKEGNTTRVALYPITGRTHQLRVHLAYLGHPILGDTLYHPHPTGRLLLHAESLSFPHPTTGKVIHFTTSPSF